MINYDFWQSDLLDFLLEENHRRETLEMIEQGRVSTAIKFINRIIFDISDLKIALENNQFYVMDRSARRIRLVAITDRDREGLMEDASNMGFVMESTRVQVMSYYEGIKSSTNMIYDNSDILDGIVLGYGNFMIPIDEQMVGRTFSVKEGMVRTYDQERFYKNLSERYLLDYVSGSMNLVTVMPNSTNDIETLFMIASERYMERYQAANGLGRA